MDTQTYVLTSHVWSEAREPLHELLCAGCNVIDGVVAVLPLLDLNRATGVYAQPEQG